MNTNALKSFAANARIKLIDQISRKLDFVLTQDTAELRGKQAEIAQLKDKIKHSSREQVIETVAYTWFNRFMALRFMDANGYTLPKVITPLPEMTNPEILQNALAGHIETELHLDRQRLNDLLDGRTASADAHTEAYKMLIVAACNYWYTAMPFMFERISDYTELLLPDDLLSDYSIVADIRKGMSDEDCQQEEILGWLYQFYISAENERLIKSKKAYAKHELAPASQLFTPKWIVKYMVDNTLGQLWSEMNPFTSILKQLEFYITPTYKDQLTPRTKKRLEDIKFFDPCVGSGHILVYAFDVFYLMYEEQGYNSSEIPELIIKHNLFGTDIDERAAQIAAFVLTMKGRRKNSRFLKKNITPNVTFYQDFEEDTKFSNAKAIGSLINVSPEEMNAFKVETGSIYAEQQQKLKQLYTFLGQRYDCVVTNPPYISSSRMEGSLKQYVEEKYQDTKSDLFATFVIRCMELCNADGLTGYMTPFVWMFISSYEKLRLAIIDNHFINNLIQLEYSGFDGATVPICTFTLRNQSIENAKGSYIRLSEFKGSENQAPRTLEAIQNPNCGWFYTANQNNFEKIPGSPISFDMPVKLIELYSQNNLIKKYVDAKSGQNTGDNNRFVRFWFEPSFSNIGFNRKSLEDTECDFPKWYPYNKGGEFRKWYGNFDNIVNWANNGKEIKDYAVIRNNGGHWSRYIQNLDFMLREGITWTFISSSYFGARYTPAGHIFDYAGCSAFSKTGNNKKYIDYFCSGVAQFILKFLNPTLNLQPGNVSTLPEPLINNNILVDLEKDVDSLIELSKQSWDSMEKSWDFKEHLFISKFKNGSNLESTYKIIRHDWKSDFQNALELEISNKQRFITAFNLEGVIPNTVSNSEVTLDSNPFFRYGKDKNEFEYETLLLQDTIKEFISYSVGCMFGRYSLDKPGLILANQGDTVADFVRIVDSGQGLVASEEVETTTSHWQLATSHYNKNNYESKQLQRFDSVAESDGLGGTGLSGYAAVSEGGNVCTHKPTTTGSGVGTVEHSRGASASIVGGVSPLFVDSTGIVGRSGNTVDFGRVSELLDCGKPEHNNATSSGSEQNDSRTHAETSHNWPLATSHYPLRFLPDADNIIPVLDGEWFSDDIVGRFKEFIKVAFSAEQLNENIGFIEDNIPAKDIRRYFVKDFYNDHIKRYKKRPIYWMFSSPKGHFKALIYMHRYQPDTCSVLLNDYLQPFISKLESAKQTQTMLSLREDLSPRDKVAASKEIDNLQKMIDDCKTYERTLFTLATQKISIDLDDGVKVNYQKFKDVLIPIKGLEKEEE